MISTIAITIALGLSIYANYAIWLHAKAINKLFDKQGEDYNKLYIRIGTNESSISNLMQLIDGNEKQRNGELEGGMMKHRINEKKIKALDERTEQIEIIYESQERLIKSLEKLQKGRESE